MSNLKGSLLCISLAPYLCSFEVKEVNSCGKWIQATSLVARHGEEMDCGKASVEFPLGHPDTVA